MRKIVAIVAGGPGNLIPNLKTYSSAVCCWIGADRGALTLVQSDINPDLAIGDFDSISKQEKTLIHKHSHQFEEHPVEKDQTDLELAIERSLEREPDCILLFGVTGGRMDHGMASIQLLYRLLKQNVRGEIIDIYNSMELKLPGKHEITNDSQYPTISFLPFSEEVLDISLDGFYYKLNNETVRWGSTLCVSNKLISEKGTFSFRAGILLVIKSSEVLI